MKGMQIMFKIVHSLGELKAYELEQGYRGHDCNWLDDMNGCPLPKEGEFPVLIRTYQSGESYNGVYQYHRSVVTPDMAWNLLWEKHSKTS
jgi:hypothetical protein